MNNIEKYFESDPPHDSLEPKGIDNFDATLLATQVLDACFAETNLIETIDLAAPWYLDSRASHHVSGQRTVFSSPQPNSGTRSTSASGTSYNVRSTGKVAIQLPSGKVHTITHVLYSPRIQKKIFFPLDFLQKATLY